MRAQLKERNDTFSASDIIDVAREMLPRISEVELVELVGLLSSEHSRLGVLNDVVRIPDVTDVIVNGHCDVWIDRGFGLERISSPWKNETELYRFAVRLAMECDKRLDELNPYVDAQLDSRIRIHIIAAPLSTTGTQIALRIAQPKPPVLHDLVQHQSPIVERVLRNIVLTQKAFLLCGGTGTGKTTLLAGMLADVPSSQRIVIVEDASELSIAHDHCAKLQSRLPNAEGIGEVTMRTLVRQALRMRPDRIIVGEVRGAEILELFAALNTGHQGCAATIHANSGKDVISRVQLLGVTNGLSDSATHAQLATAIDLVIDMQRIDGVRQVHEIGALKLVNDRCEYFPIITFTPEVKVHSHFDEYLDSDAIQDLSC